MRELTVENFCLCLQIMFLNHFYKCILYYRMLYCMFLCPQSNWTEWDAKWSHTVSLSNVLRSVLIDVSIIAGDPLQVNSTPISVFFFFLLRHLLTYHHSWSEQAGGFNAWTVLLQALKQPYCNPAHRTDGMWVVRYIRPRWLQAAEESRTL